MLLRVELLVAVIFFMGITHGFMVLEEWLLAKTKSGTESLNDMKAPEWRHHIAELGVVLEKGRNGGEDTFAHWPTTPDMMTIDEVSCEVFQYWWECEWGPRCDDFGEGQGKTRNIDERGSAFEALGQTVYSGVITWLESLWFGDSGSDMDRERRW